MKYQNYIYSVLYKYHLREGTTYHVIILDIQSDTLKKDYQGISRMYIN